MKMFDICYDEVNCTHTTKFGILVTCHAFIMLDSFGELIWHFQFFMSFLLGQLGGSYSLGSVKWKP